jgi:hypothetical protein
MSIPILRTDKGLRAFPAIEWPNVIVPSEVFPQCKSPCEVSCTFGAFVI